MSKKTKNTKNKQKRKSSTGFVPGPNDVQLPYVQHPVGDAPLEHHPADCHLRRPGHVVRPINAWHRDYPILVMVLPPPDNDADLPAFEQRFMLIERDRETGQVLPKSCYFVVHNPQELKAYLKEVGGNATYSWSHNSLFMKGLSCNAGFSPCFSTPYPCSAEVGEGWSELNGHVAYRTDPDYKDGIDLEGGPSSWQEESR